MSALGPTPAPLLSETAIAVPAAPTPSSSGDYALYHAILLAIAIGVLVVACLLQVRPDQRVALSGWPDWPFPETCQSKVTFGVPCPGCGLTRSFVYLAHGNLAASLAVHPIGWLIALFVAAQIPYRFWALRTRNSAPLGERAPWIITTMLFLLLIATWIVRIAT